MKIEKPNPLGSSTILELADDYAKAYSKGSDPSESVPMGRPEEARKLLQAAIMNAEVQKYNAENMVVSRFDEERLPTFRQGIPEHELEDHVTAQQCEWFVKTIDDLRNEVNRLKAESYACQREWADKVVILVDALEHMVEPVYQYQLANGNWIDQTKESYDYNVKHGQATVRMLYAAPQAAPLYAKEQQ